MGSGGVAESLSRPARRQTAGVRRSDSMRSILAAHIQHQGARDRLRGAAESTTSKRLCLWWTSGAPRRILPSERPLLPTAGVAVSGVALSGQSARSPRHVSSAHSERCLLGYAPRGRLYRTQALEIRRHRDPYGSAARQACSALHPVWQLTRTAGRTAGRSRSFPLRTAGRARER